MSKRYKKGFHGVCKALRRRLQTLSRPARAQKAPKSEVSIHSSTSSRIYVIRPQLTDVSINRWLEPHYVAFNPYVRAKGNLFLFLCGSYGHPGRQRLIIHQAAEMGYHAINLRYPNFWKVADLCQNSSDIDCHAKVRREIIYGIDQSGKIAINHTNSIQNRLVKLLLYLQQHYPEDGWLQYLDEGTPKWESMLVAGHSQGGGHAAMIAQEHEVTRVILFAAPADTCRAHRTLAPWISAPHATPSERYYGFSHVRDKGLAKIQQAWQLLEMDAYGSIVDVDTHHPPYNGSHQLVTAARPARPGKYHGSVVVDHSTPRQDDGSPLFQEAWQYLCCT